jgi:site-specific recombinase XerD
MNRRKKLPSQRHKGLYVYCTTCKKYFSWTSKTEKSKLGKITTKEPLCGVTKNKFSKCPNFEKHKYRARVHVPGTQSTTASRTFDATTYNDAVAMTIDFENEFKTEILTTTNTENSGATSTYLFDAQIEYLNFLDNIDVPEHLVVKRSERHIKEQAKCLELFNEALNSNKLNKRIIPIHRITDKHVGYFHSHLADHMGYANKTYNNKMGSLKSFLDWAIKQYSINIKNPFNEVKQRTSKTNIETITKKEFKNLIDPKNMCSENGIIEVGKKKIKRNMFRDYLSNGIELCLHTGGRREEVVELKWNMVHKIDGEIAYIEFDNLKVERILGDGFNDNVDTNIIPITKDLKNLLLRLNYEEKKNTDDYILYPDRDTQSTPTIMDNLSKGFTHFYKRLNTGRELQLKSLRKTYMTYLKLATGGDMRKLDSHSTDEVLDKHYIDKKIIKKAIAELTIFGD